MYRDIPDDYALQNCRLTVNQGVIDSSPTEGGKRIQVSKRLGFFYPSE